MSNKVAIIMGSDSDLETMSEAAVILKEFGVNYSLKVLSAHRSPEFVKSFAVSAKKDGIKVIIAGAGGAAALAGVIASYTILPVLGVPIQTKALDGLDSLLSTVQMPAGIPVGTLAVGKSGAKNAALLAIEILAINDKGLQNKLTVYKKRLAASVKKANLKICK